MFRQRRQQDFLGLLLMWVAILSSRAAAQNSCQTISRTNGRCIPYHKCNYVTQQHAQFDQVIPPAFVDFLRRSRCAGPSNAVVIHICCEIEDMPSVSGTTTTRRPLTNNQDYASRFNPAGLAVLNSMKCGPQNSNRIAHGNKTDLAEFPWMALLRYNSEQPFQCGGSLITNRYVLTAAHCIVGVFDELIGVRLGEHDLTFDRDCQRRGNREVCSPPIEDFGIEEKIPHPKYSEQLLTNDVALIRLDRDVRFKLHIKPICLPIVQSASMPINQEYFIAGWGTTEFKNTSNVLLKAKVQHRDNQVCHDIFQRVHLTENHICAGGDGITDTCKGDSGGPLFYLADYKGLPRYVQFGIVSFGGVVCGSDKTYPGIYANLLDLLPWVTDNIV